MKSFRTLLLPFVMLASLTAYGQGTQHITQTRNYTGTPNFSRNLQFNQFNPALGTLQSIRVQMNMNTAGGYLSADNDGDTPAVASVQLGANGGIRSDQVNLLNNSFGAIGANMSVATGSTLNLAADDGDGPSNVDPSAPDGATHIGGTDSQSADDTVNPAVFATPGKSYVGTGSYTVIMDANALIDFGGLGGVEGGFGPPTVDGEVTITYEYIPFSADLFLDKKVGSTTPELGENVGYTLYVKNNGPDEAVNVQVTEHLPAGVTYLGETSGGNYDPVTGIWSVGNLANGASASIKISAQVAGTGSILNTASAASDVADPNLSDNSDSVTLTVPPQIDLELHKYASTSTPTYLSQFTYTVTVTNTSTFDDATGVTVTDLLPAAVKYISHSGGSYDKTTGLWDVGGVAKNGGSRSLVITVQALTTGGIGNTASVTTADQQDVDSTPGVMNAGEDDWEKCSVTVPTAADLRITKTADSPTAVLGGYMRFTIRVNNDGPGTVNSFTIKDALPAGLVFERFTGFSEGMHYDPATGIFSFDNGTLMMHQMMVFEYIAYVTGTGPLTNTAQIWTSDVYDPDSTPGNSNGGEDDQSSTTVTVPSVVNLALSKTVNNATPNYGDVISYTLTVSNSSTTDDATGVVVKDMLPTALQWRGDNSGGAYNPDNNVWTVGTVPRNGGSRSIILNMRVRETGSITNPAEVTHCTESDANSTPGNGDKAEDDWAEVGITVPDAADLELTISELDLTTPALNDVGSFVVEVTNNGPNTATGVQVKNLLPAGLEFSSLGTSDGTYTSGTGMWVIGTLNVGQTVKLNYKANLRQTGPLINTAQVTAVDQYDPDSTPNNGIATEDDQDSVQLDVPRIVDLRLEKNVNNATPDYRSNITYTLTVTNDGPDPAAGIVVSDQLPLAMVWISDNAPGQYDKDTGLWTVGSLASGASASIEITAHLVSTGIISNTAEITACDDNDTDSTPGNHVATEDDQDDAVISVAPAADLHLEKSVDNAAARLGENVVFTVTVSNDGPDVASAITVLDALPAGFAFQSATPSQGSYDNGSGLWTVGSMNANATVTLSVTAQVTATGNKTNTARVESSDLYDPDSTPGNNIETEDDQDSAIVNTPSAADVRLVKNVNNATPTFGSNVVYSVAVTNDGPDAATGLTVTDLLPSNLVYVSHSGGSYDENSGLWSVGTLNATASASLQITARVNGTGSMINTAQVSAVNEFDIDSTPANNIASEDDQDAASIDVAPAVDLSLDKSASPMNPGNGENVIFTLTVTNSSPHNNATGVVVEDNLVPGLTYVSSTGDGSYDPATGRWTTGDVFSGGGTRSIALTVRVDQAGALPNFAEVIACNEWDMDSTPGNGEQGEDDEDKVTLGVLEVADLSLSKVVDNATPLLSQNVVYTLTLNNAGPDAGSNIEVEDVLPAGVRYVSHTGGSYDSGTGRWDIAAMTVGETATLAITAEVVGTGSTINTAQVGAADQRDPDSTPDNGIAAEDDQDAVEITVPAMVDLSLSKTADKEIVNYKSNVTFTVTVTNTLPLDDATGVTVTDHLPAGLTYVSSTGDGSYNAETGLWTVGTVAKDGGTATMAITARADTTVNLENSAEITACDQEDIDSVPGNNSVDEDDDDRISIAIPEAADLRLSKHHNNNNAALGDTVTFTVRVWNDGPDTATNVRVSDKLPDSFEFISSDGQGSYSPTRGFWRIGTLPSGQSVILTVVTVMRSTGSNTNYAEVYESDQYDPDSTPNNSDGSEDDWDYATINGPAAIDLELTKTASTLTPVYMGQLDYTLTVSNVSAYDDATGVVVSDRLPDGLAFLSVSGDGSYNPETGAWTVGLLRQSGGTASITLKTRVETTGPIVNFAQVSACVQPDLDSTPGNGEKGEDDEAAVTVHVAPAADVSLSKTVNLEKQYAEEIIRYTLTTANAGPDSALGIVVTDALPEGVVFVADSGDGSFDAATGLWTVGAIGAGESRALHIDARLTTAMAPVLNRAEVTAADRYDPDSTPGAGEDEDDDDSVIVQPLPHVDLSLSKTVNRDTVGLGEPVIFTLIAQNDGPSAASAITVKDLMPPGLVYLSHTSGQYSALTGLWALGNLDVGGRDTLVISATAESPGSVVNIAEIAACTEDDIDSTPANGIVGEDDRATAAVYVKAAGLGDTVWQDADGNGQLDDGETGLKQVTVKVLVGERIVAQSKTDSTGRYFFANLSAGRYTVWVDTKTLPAGMGLTTANQPMTVDLVEGAVVLNADFGYKPSGGSIGDELWLDSNADGIRSTDEAQGLAGVTVQLKDLAGRLLVKTATDEDGHYLFTGLMPGSYRVEVDVNTLAAGLSLTTPGYRIIELALDQALLTADFGARMPEGNVGSIGNLLWIDTDRDGVQDADERQGIAGITVVLTDGSGNEIDRDVTDDDGNYLFNYLPAGAYWVDVNSHDEDMPEGHYLTTANEPYFVNLATGEDHVQADFGYMTLAPGRAVLGDYTWHDANWNRHQDDPESELGWVDVTLYQNGEPVATQKTDLWGFYRFVNLLPGTYMVKAEQAGPTPPQPQAAGKASFESWQMTTLDSFSVTLNAGDVYTKADFGFAYPQENWGDGQEKILARYQPWFGDETTTPLERHWRREAEGGQCDTSMIGRYSSLDSDVIDYHILSAWAAGIDGFVVDWNGRRTEENIGTRRLLDRALRLTERFRHAGMDFQVAISYSENASGALDSNLVYIADSLMAHNAYWGTRDGLRQPLFIFDTEDDVYTAGTYRACADTTLPAGALLIWNNADPTTFSSIDGVYPWVQPFENRWDAQGMHWGEGHLEATYETVNREVRGRLAFILGAVWPGFDDREWVAGEQRFMSRQDTVVYQKTWDHVHAYRADPSITLPMNWCLVETWNDFNCATQIEPTTDYGYIFSRITRDNARRFKSSKSGDEVGVNDLGLQVPLHLYQARVSAKLNPQAATGIEALVEKAEAAFFNRDYERAISYADVAAGLAIGSLQVSQSETGAIDVTWQKAEDAEAYWLCYSSDPTVFKPNATQLPMMIPVGDVDHYTLEGVDAGSACYITVIAVNSALGPFANHSGYENSVTGVEIQCVGGQGEDSGQTVVDIDQAAPDAFALDQNYPNPFNPSTALRYVLPQSMAVKVQVFNIRGEEVALLVDERKTGGAHEVVFEAGHLPSGLYFCRIQAGHLTQIRRMVLLK